MQTVTAIPETGFWAPATLLERPIRVLLIGAGGTGGEMLDRLIRLHFGLVRTGHPGGLEVTLWDGDTVSDANIGRQRFAPCDVGYNKADLLIHRANLAFGLRWRSEPRYFDTKAGFHYNSPIRETDLIITCVDKAAFRAALGRLHFPALWLDTGNDATKAQVVLGHGPACGGVVRFEGRELGRLPTVTDLYPDMDEIDDDEEPSCSFAEAIAKQDLMINPWVADAAANLLWQVFRHGHVTYHGAVLDVRAGTVKPLAINPAVWEWFGYEAPEVDDDGEYEDEED